MQKRHITILVITALALLLLLLPIRFSYTIHVPGKVLPVREWLLQRSPDGNLAAVRYSYLDGMVEDYQTVQVERGDAGQFSVYPAIQAYRHIERGDTVGIFYSNEAERRLQELRGELQTARSLLAVNAAGEKPGIIEAARQQVGLAERRAREQRRIFQRQKGLHEQELVSLQELDAAQTASEVADLQEQIARAALQNASSGAKPEQIAYLQTRVAVLQKEIAVLKKRSEQFTLVSPMAGIVSPTFSRDTLILISDTTQQVILLPVRLAERAMITRDQTIDIQGGTSQGEMTARIVHIDHQVRRINGEEMLFVTALVADARRPLAPGSIVRGAIHCAGMTLWEYLRQSARSITIN